MADNSVGAYQVCQWRHYEARLGSAYTYVCGKPASSIWKAAESLADTPNVQHVVGFSTSGKPEIISYSHDELQAISSLFSPRFGAWLQKFADTKPTAL